MFRNFSHLTGLIFANLPLVSYKSAQLALSFQKVNRETKLLIESILLQGQITKSYKEIETVWLDSGYQVSRSRFAEV